MDTRRKMDERHDRLRVSRVRFVETYREKVLEEQPLGAPLVRDVIVIRIDKARLKVSAFLAGFVVPLIVVAVVAN